MNLREAAKAIIAYRDEREITTNDAMDAMGSIVRKLDADELAALIDGATEKTAVNNSNSIDSLLKARDSWINTCRLFSDALREMVRCTDNSTNLQLSAARRDAQRLIDSLDLSKGY